MPELGFPNFDSRGFVGLAAPAKTPAPIIAYLNKALNDVVQSEDFKSRMAALGMTVPADNTPKASPRQRGKPSTRANWRR